MLEEVDHCRFYGKGEYASCLKTEISNQLNSTLKCIPPWFGFEYKKVLDILHFDFYKTHTILLTSVGL